VKIHIVQKGDTLWKIAKKYGVNFEELKTMNAQLSNPDMIMPGMKIKVPTSGGSIKKEVAGANKEAPINYGMKKEMPKAEHPFKEEKPKTIPVAEKPVEKPKPKPYTPKMPQPVIPEIDINNYYMMNMANMQTQPKEKPKMPPKPTNILPKPEEEKVEIPKQKPIKESVKDVQQQQQEEESLEIPTQPQGGFTQPMFFNPNYCVPVSPVMPGPGYGAPYGGMPGGYGPSYGAGMPGSYGGPEGYPMGQVQGASTLPGMHQGLPGVENPGMMHGMGYDDESSSIMPYMNQMPMHGGNPSEVMGAHAQQPMGYPTGVMGAGSQPQQPMGYPTDVMGAYGQQPMGQPSGVMGVQDEENGYPSVQMPQMGQMPAMPQGPFNDNCYPVSPVMPGSGFHGMNPYGGVPGAVQGVQSMPGGYGMPGMHGGYPGGYPMGQVQGAMMDESPMAQHGQMPENDCGCGGPKAVSPMAQMPMGQMPMGQPHMGQPYGHGTMGQGMPMGPGGYPQGGQGMFGPRAFGMPQVNDDDVEG
jgi:morphogenetic protein associated with SpoVID